MAVTAPRPLQELTVQAGMNVCWRMLEVCAIFAVRVFFVEIERNSNVSNMDVLMKWEWVKKQGCCLGTKTQKAKGIPDNAEIFTADTMKGGAKKPELAKLLGQCNRMSLLCGSVLSPFGGRSCRYKF